MEESRTKKTIRNTAFSFCYKFVDLLLAFALRTLFIRALGISYLGISGLFTNILTILSLMELGVGSAIVFSLYKPLAMHDNSKVAALMALYRKIYNIIGIIISIVGIAITPCLHQIINLPNDVEGIYIIYWLTIANTAVTYFLSYRRSLLMADQRSDINTKNLIVFRLIRFFALVGVLYLTHSYIVYLSVDVCITIVSNIQITYVIKRRYKDIEESVPDEITDDEKRDIIKYMMSGIYSKIGQTVVTSTDNIIISAFISTILVGVYSNYSMVTNNLEIIVYMFFNGITASVGNFAITSTGAESEKLFKRVFLANYGIAFVATICVFSLISPFVSLWVGKEYLLSNFTVAVLCVNLYIALLQKSVENFMGAVGEMFYINRYRSIVEACVNLGVSIVLVKYTDLGITGVFLGTTVCFVFGRMWMDAHTLYKYWFRISSLMYFKSYIFKALLTAISAFLFYNISNKVFSMIGISWFSLFGVAILLFVCSSLLFIAIYVRTEEFKYYIDLVKKIVGKKRRN